MRFVKGLVKSFAMVEPSFDSHKSFSRSDLFDFMTYFFHLGSHFSSYCMGESIGMGDRLHSTESLMDGVRKLQGQPQPSTPTRARGESTETCLKSKCPMKHVRSILFIYHH